MALRQLFLIALLMLGLSACTTTGSTPAAKQQAVLKMRDETLVALFKRWPETQQLMAEAPGYAVFSTANLHVLLAGVGAGYGLVQNSETGDLVYLKAAEFGFGPGTGIKDERLVLIFGSEESLNRFVERGWSVGAQASAAAKASDKGTAKGAEAVVGPETRAYRMTQSGLALEATVNSLRYWADEELNVRSYKVNE